MKDVVVQRVGMNIMSVNLLDWKKHEGGFVRKGEPLFIVESNIAITEFASLYEGNLNSILISQGEVNIGDVIGIIDGK
ncbi:MAG: lipoyl domain-containing protein [Sedimentibacter sp.]